MSKKILVIDDEEWIVLNLQDFFEDNDFEVSTAGNGSEGLAALQKETPDIVIVDLNMPVMDGFEFIEKAKADYPNLPIIVLSGAGLIDDAMRAIRAGAWDFLSKPLKDMSIALYTIDRCLERFHLIQENIQYQQGLEELVKKRTLQLENTKQQIIKCLGKAAEFKDNETGNHVLRVAQMSYILAKGLGLEETFCGLVRDAAPMHDVGKIGILDKVLLKNGPLDDEEWDHMKKHVIFGYRIMSSKDNSCHDPESESPLSMLDQDDGDDIITIAKRIALFHHERWDGKGYPFGLEKEKIPLEARIVSLVDVYDAISSKRPYKEAFPEDKCQKIIREGDGTQFDPAVVKVFFDNIDKLIDAKKPYLD